MTEVFVDNTDADTRIDPGPADVVVVLDQELEIIQTLEQGPPGPQGPVGPVGPPGPQGPTGYVPGMQNPATENQNMNGFFIRNLPAAVQPYDAVRLQDLSVFSGPGADTTFPNFRIPKLGAFTVDNSENGSTLAMAGAAQYTVTFGDPTTYDANFLVLIVNQDDSYAKDVVGVTTVERFRLYPHQTAIVYRSGGTWECLRQNRWRPPGGNLPIYYNPDTGNDNNDGLTPGNAYRDGSLAFYNINADVDGRGTAGANTRVLIIQADNTTFHGNFHLAVHGTPGAQGGAAFGFRGGVNSVIDSTSMGGSCFELYFGPYSIDNFKLISNAAGIACANQSIAFVGPGMDFGACQTHIQVGNGGSVILGNDYRISGTPSFAHVVAESGGSFQAYGTINIAADLSPSYFAFGGQGSISFHGAINLNGHTVTGTRFFAGNGSVVQGGGVPDDPLYFPGSAPGIIAAGGQYGSIVNITGSTSATNTVTSTTPSTSPTTGALTVAGGLGVAGALNAAGKLTVSLNASPLSTPLPTSVAQFGGPNGSNARISVEAYGGAPAMDFRAASNTAASPGAVITDQLIGLFTASGHNGSAFPAGAAVAIQFKAGGTWTPTSTPAYVVFRTTPVGSTSPADALRLNSDASVTIPGDVTISNKLVCGGAARVTSPYGGRHQFQFDAGTQGGMDIVGTSAGAAGVFMDFLNNNGAAALGNISIVGGAPGTGVAYNTVSDGRLKEDLRDYVGAGNVIDALKIWDFRWKTSGERGVGVIAQEAIEVYPDAVSAPRADDDDLRWGVDYSRFVPVLIAEVQALRRRVAKLEQAQRSVV